MNRPGPAIPREQVALRFSERLISGWMISGTYVVMLEGSLADAVMARLREPPTTQAVTEILAWLDAAPEDWPFTGADIAQFIRNGCPEWTETDSAQRLQRAAQGDVADWIDEQDWEKVPASFVADCVREQFDLEPAADRVPPAGPADWEAMGFEPGDVVGERGEILLSDGFLIGGGKVMVTKRQATLAGVFGWKLCDGGAVQGHNKGQPLVYIQRA